VRLLGPRWKPPLLAAAAVLAAATFFSSPAQAVIEGMEGKIAFQRWNGSNYDVWIREARLPECSDGLDNDGDGEVDVADVLGCVGDDRDESQTGNQPIRDPAPLPGGSSGGNDTEPAWANNSCPTLPCGDTPPAEDPDALVTQLEQVLAFVSDRDGTRDVWSVNSTGATSKLTGGLADDGSPSICCRLSLQQMMAFDRDPGGNRDIYAMHLDEVDPDGNGDGERETCRLTTDPAPDSNPDWSPDGRHIAFERHVGGETQIWVMEVDIESTPCQKLGQERQVTGNQPSSFEPSWFEWTNPEDGSETRGHRIAFSGPEDRSDRNIHYIEQSYEGPDSPPTPFDGQTPIVTATPFDEPSEERGPSWSPRGDGLVFASTRGGGDFDIYFLDESSAAPPVLVQGEPGSDPDELNPAIQPVPVTDSVKAFRICGRACRARRRTSQRGPAGAASAAPLTPSESRRRGSCTVRGTRRGDRLRGTRRADVICGLGGNDTMFGFGGNDTLRGGPGRDRLRGMAGRDRLFGDSGRDDLSGGPGPDVLSGGPGLDRSLGGPGADRFLARGGGRDRIRGGSGRDTGLVDRRDNVQEVERRPR
jgi:hypothetical protein